MKKKGHDRWIREITWKTRVEKNKIKKTIVQVSSFCKPE